MSSDIDAALNPQYGLSPYRPPWENEITRFKPVSLRHALFWCEWAVESNQLLKAALRRLVSYFITDLNFLDVEQKEEERLRDYFYNILHIDEKLYSIGMDYLTYGNSFITIFVPIIRSVVCPKCKYSVNFLHYSRKEGVNFEFKGKRDFVLTCLKCKYRGPWEIVDKKSNDESTLSIIRWNPHDIEILYDPLSQQSEYYWRISSEYVQKVKLGHPLVLANIPLELLETIQNIDSGYYFRFDENMIVHLKDPAIAGLRMNGWGLSPILANFNQIWYTEVLRKANTTIAYDFTLPIRILTPEVRQGHQEYSDPLMTTKLDSINANLQGIIASWRKNQSGWFTCPFPLRYQPIGGEGNRILPPQLLDQANTDLIAGLGIPLEFFKGTLTVQALPIATRIMENSWSSLRRIFNIFLNEVARALQTKFRWDNFRVVLTKPSLADDINKQMAVLQLALQDVVSMSTGLRSVGLSYVDELNKKLKEQEIQIKEYNKLQEKLQDLGLTQMLSTPQQGEQAGAGGLLGMLGGLLGGAQGGAQGGEQGGGGASGAGQGAVQGMQQDPITALLSQIPASAMGPVTLDSLTSTAQSVAQQLYGMQPTLRNSALRQLKQRNNVIHALVLQELRRLNESAEAVGRSQAQEQAQSQAQGQPSMPIG